LLWEGEKKGLGEIVREKEKTIPEERRKRGWGDYFHLKAPRKKRKGEIREKRRGEGGGGRKNKVAKKNRACVKERTHGSISRRDASSGGRGEKFKSLLTER